MRGGVARQNSDVHPDTFAGEAKEPFHGRAGKVRSARRGITARTDPAASLFGRNCPQNRRKDWSGDWGPFPSH